MQPAERREQLCAAIEAAAPAAIDAALADLYQNPFWDDRYGQRGRHFAREDNFHHINYLVTTIRVDSPQISIDYYKWLQTLLVSRGMCSYHIRQNIAQLGHALQQRLPAEWPEIAPYLAAGYNGLEYPHPACQGLAAAEDRIAVATAPRLYGMHPFWQSHYGDRGQRLCEEDVRYMLSYLQDEVGSGTAGLFRQYVGWLMGYLDRQGIGHQHLGGDMQILAAEIMSNLPAEEAQPFVAILGATASTLKAGDGPKVGNND